MIDFNILKERFIAEYGACDRPIECFFAPGRVNLIGEHIEFNGGNVFPVALTLGISGAIRLRDDNLVVLKSKNASGKFTIDIRAPIEYKVVDGWANYPKGVIKYLLASGHRLCGCEVLLFSDLPDGTGLSSSAAILVLTAYMLRTISGESAIDKVELARFCQRVENQFIGVNCGIMDQFAVALGKKDCAVLLDCQTLKYQYIPFDFKNYRLVILNTNKKRELSNSKYNERRSECDQALAIIRKHRHINNLCQANLAEVETYVKSPTLYRRARHAVTENNRVALAIDCLQNRDIIGFGSLMILSHLSLQEDYEVTGFELDSIVEAALKAPGCIGARMTGAGFGGCAIALVESERLQDFCALVTLSYAERTGRMAELYVSGIADGVTLVENSH